MIKTKDFIEINGSWKSDSEVIEEVLSNLIENGLYKPVQIYRFEPSEKRIRREILSKAGNTNERCNLGSNRFYGCYENLLDHYHDVLGANKDNFCYLIGYKSEKVNEVFSTVFEFKDLKKKKESLDFVVELFYED